MLARGSAVREALKQPQYDPLSATEQLAILVAATEGHFDNVPPDRIVEASDQLREALPERLPLLPKSIESGKTLSDNDRQALSKVAKEIVGAIWQPPKH
jgi:F-type H+-transporting ATPase subunit alpha